MGECLLRAGVKHWCLEMERNDWRWLDTAGSRWGINLASWTRDTRYWPWVISQHGCIRWLQCTHSNGWWWLMGSKIGNPYLYLTCLYCTISINSPQGVMCDSSGEILNSPKMEGMRDKNNNSPFWMFWLDVWSNDRASDILYRLWMVLDRLKICVLTMILCFLSRNSYTWNY